MFWERLTGVAMIAGGLSGTAAALVVWLAVASTYEGGLGDWYKNTGEGISSLEWFKGYLALCNDVYQYTYISNIRRNNDKKYGYPSVHH